MRTNPDLAVQKYRGHAETYDRRAARGNFVRRQAIARLCLKPGDAVLEVACGTGINFPALENAIGDEGHIIGIDLSPEMLAKAREMIASHGWQNITLVQARAEEASIPRSVDALLFSFTHDILQSPRALENAIASLKPGGRVVAASMKWAPRWAVPVNLYVWYEVRRWITTFDGLRQPWAHLGRLVRDLQVESVLFGATFIAWGTASPHGFQTRP